MKIKCLSNGSYSLKNCHNPFGKANQPPPPPYGKMPVEHLKSLHGASLTELIDIVVNENFEASILIFYVSCIFSCFQSSHIQNQNECVPRLKSTS